ncbi:MULTISPECIES: replicative DNA helicase [Weeksella]|uniref:Replicative DNA helicase n=1 Tax=Weeksella virosa (strain ATCC 43766 / DSM 16922 / JCM 21250 / CCUG 30538 / CDC 9751 / IAM 14551 / NBRC 16016 / NCTC 11634 / CL345/78) TaxID=865938 RepID=F0P1B0_WEEVC|nr:MULTISPECIES: replicative DNA helicase [Weeksella]ADX68624.1 replicative DNA helicase [Weeksella virosa DSM 16922]MDK7375843.1 replicative DNA helicase [Weeksella virosa]MDK7676276.1 replicative DNA helicase [Weeksella virosa]OFM82341.1 replicative DNA helicase [Weeksella sp. HMSC059D05]SUP54965.1 Replicative DNA helicase [Weeksella virosa]
MEQLKQSYSKTNQTNSVINLEKGKLPPQAIELEQAVLGAMMIDKKGLDDVIDILSPEVFYRPEHQAIYAAIQKLFNDSQPIDLLTVSNELKISGKLDLIGGDYFLIQLTQKVSSSAHIEYYARAIQENYIKRKLIEISSEVIRKSYDDTSDVFDLLDFTESKLFEITEGGIKRSYSEAGDLVKEALEKIKDMSTKEGMSGLPSGFTEIDKITSGWQQSDLIILAARPGMGKTAFILSMAKNMTIDHKIPVAIFSLEMSSVQLITRMISGETGISGEKLRKATLADYEWKQLYTKVKGLEEAPLYIDDTPALSIFDLRAKARRLVSQHGVRMILIDYLQLMTAGGKANGNREQEISMISRSLKAIAKELNIPVIALSQLSRSVETRGGSKRPLLSDLRESGAIEQDADIVSFIYRPEYYKLEVWDDEIETPCAGQAEFIIAKHRNGALENIRLRFIGEQAKFTDLDNSSFEDEYTIPSSMNKNKQFGSDSDFTFDSSINLPTGNPLDSFSGLDSYKPYSRENEDDDLGF